MQRIWQPRVLDNQCAVLLAMLCGSWLVCSEAGSSSSIHTHTARLVTASAWCTVVVLQQERVQWWPSLPVQPLAENKPGRSVAVSWGCVAGRLVPHVFKPAACANCAFVACSVVLLAGCHWGISCPRRCGCWRFVHVLVQPAQLMVAGVACHKHLEPLAALYPK